MPHRLSVKSPKSKPSSILFEFKENSEEIICWNQIWSHLRLLLEASQKVSECQTSSDPWSLQWGQNSPGFYIFLQASSGYFV